MIVDVDDLDRVATPVANNPGAEAIEILAPPVVDVVPMHDRRELVYAIEKVDIDGGLEAASTGSISVKNRAKKSIFFLDRFFSNVREWSIQRRQTAGRGRPTSPPDSIFPTTTTTTTTSRRHSQCLLYQINYAIAEANVFSISFLMLIRATSFSHGGDRCG